MSQRILQKPKRRRLDYRQDPCRDVFTCRVCGTMEPVAVWVRKGGEWAIIHRCKICGVLHSNRVAADDNPMLLMSLAVKPLAAPPFPLDRLERAAE